MWGENQPYLLVLPERWERVGLEATLTPLFLPSLDLGGWH